MPKPKKAEQAPDFIPADAQPDFIPAESAPEQPSPANRFASSAFHALGLPANKQEFQEGAAREENRSFGDRLMDFPVLGPMLTPRTIVAGGKSLMRGGEEGNEAFDALSRGDLTGAAAHGVGGLGYTAAGLLTPAGGQNLVTSGEQFGRGDVAGGFGTAAPMLAPSLIRGAADVPVRAPIRMLGRTMEESAPRVAEFAAHPVASTVRPIVRGAIRKGGRVLQKVAGPEAGAAAQPAATPRPMNLERPSPVDTETAAAPERGMWSADPRTQEQILEDVRNRRGVGQGKVAMRVDEEAPPATVPAPRSSRPGFGTAPENIPIEERMDMSGFYGSTPTRSNLAAHQRQLASPTFSTAPGQTPLPPEMPRFVPKEDMTPEDYALQNEHMADIMAADLGQRRLNKQLPRPRTK